MIPAAATAALNTVNPTSPSAVTLCALSAHFRPIRTVLSNELSFPRFANAAAALNLAIFCCAVSPAGAEPKSICVPDDGTPGLPVKFIEPDGLVEA